VGVGLSSFTEYSAVTVHGGDSAPCASISAVAARQLQWQSSSAPAMPPLSTPGNASWCFSGVHRATKSSPSAKLRMCKPLGLAGPQPKQAFWGAYRSWMDGWLMSPRA